MTVSPKSRSCYTTGCGHAACRDANTAYQRDRRRRSGPSMVDATAARNVILRRLAKGEGTRTIAADLGMNRTTVVAIARGLRPTIQRHTAQRILSGTRVRRNPSATFGQYPRYDLGTFTRAQLLAMRSAS